MILILLVCLTAWCLQSGMADLPASSEGEGSSSCALSTDSSDAPNVQSLISVLKVPKHSDLSCSRLVAVNHKAKRPRRSSASSSSDPQSASPSQRAREFSSEYVCVSGGKLFCKACRDELSLKKSTIEKHVSSAKHSAGKERIVKEM